MTPSFTTDNFPDLLLTDAKVMGNIDLPIAASEARSDGTDFIGSERSFSTEVWSSKGIPVLDNGIRVVSRPTSPFQVARSVVAPVVVNMSHFGETVRIGDECERHKLVDAELLLVAVSEKANAEVPVIINFRGQNCSGLGHDLGASSPNVGNDAIKASHSARAADFVKAFVARYWTPFLDHGRSFFTASSYRDWGISASGEPRCL